MTMSDESTAAPRRTRKSKSAPVAEPIPFDAPSAAEASDAAPSVEPSAVPSEGSVHSESGAAHESTADAEIEAPAEMAAEAPLEDPEAERRRIREQLEALQRKQAELRRALAIADHPDLADAIRIVEGHAYVVTRAEAKMAQGLSKAEERRRDALEKKLASTRAKRDELDAQIAELEKELAPLGIERTRAFEAERRAALEKLTQALGAHTAAFTAVGLELTSLLPELGRWMPEVEAIAKDLVARAPTT